jgi:hypothetical protein
MKYLKLFVLLIIALFLDSCLDTDTDKDGLPDDQDKCPTVMAKSKDGCPVPVKIDKVHLYLDNSASMEGYFTGATEFKTIVADMVVKVDKEIGPVDISYIADKTMRYKKGITDFTSAMATTPIALQKSSELQRMVSDVVAGSGKNDVSLLISDCILSFPNAAVKANPNINRDNAGSVLKNNIYASFFDLKSKGFGASVYAFHSKFNGIYYDFQNKKIKLKGASRPFYIWVIAPDRLTQKFTQEVERITTFKPENVLYFGLGNKPVNSFAILPELERKGNWSRSESGIGDIEMVEGKPLQIAVALDLSSLPSYAQDVRYLQENLKVNSINCKIKYGFRVKNGSDVSKLHANEQIRSLEAASHVMYLTITDMPLPKASVKLTLPQKYDTWYRDWSTMDDQLILNQQTKTFAFEHLINGVREAFETRDKNFIDLSLTLSK